MNIKILYEDDDIIVAIKPQGIPSQPDKTGDLDMLTMLSNQLSSHGENTYVGIVHRLDRPVGGVMIFSRNKTAEKRLSTAIQQNQYQKDYLAIVTGKLETRNGKLQNFLKKNGKNNTSSVVGEKIKDAKKAELNYEVLESKTDENEQWLSLVKIRLITGRHHQIRVQFAHMGAGIWGDKKYNASLVKKYEKTNIALWSHSISLYHPVTHKTMQFQASPTEYPFSLFF